MTDIRKQMSFTLEGKPVFQGFPDEWTLKDQIVYLDLFSRDGNPKNPADIPDGPSMVEGIFQVIKICNPPKKGETPRDHEIRLRGHWKIQQQVTDFPDQAGELIKRMETDHKKFLEFRQGTKKILLYCCLSFAGACAGFAGLAILQPSAWIYVPIGVVLAVPAFASIMFMIVSAMCLMGDKVTIMSIGTQAFLARDTLRDLEPNRTDLISKMKAYFKSADGILVPSNLRQEVWKQIEDIQTAQGDMYSESHSDHQMQNGPITARALQILNGIKHES